LLERRGEFDRFARYRETLKNRMLLWHGEYLLINYIYIQTAPFPRFMETWSFSSNAA
jgi:hypothetical protein